MKYFTLFLFLLLAAFGANAQSAAPATEAQSENQADIAPAPERPISAREADKRARKARRKGNGAEVYKGTLAQKRRVIVDAPNAEEDQEPAEDAEASTQPAVADKKTAAKPKH